MSNPLESWTEEQRSALLYRTCADAENDSARAELFRRLAGEAEAQAAIWRAQLTARGHPAPTPYVPDARTRIVMSLVSKLGPRRMRAMLAAMKVRGMGIYDLTLPKETGHAAPRPGSGGEHRHHEEHHHPRHVAADGVGDEEQRDRERFDRSRHTMPAVRSCHDHPPLQSSRAALRARSKQGLETRTRGPEFAGCLRANQGAYPYPAARTPTPRD